jgi:hypothetical protein
MRTKVLLLTVLLGAFFNSDAQRWKHYRWETIYGAGVSNSLTDLGGRDRTGTNGLLDTDGRSTRPALMVGMRFKQTQQISHKLNLTIGMIAANDQLTKEKYRSLRNLHFRSPILELGYNFEFYLKKEKRGHRFKLRGVKGLKNMGLYPYGFFGISTFFFAPQAKVGGEWKWLKPLTTEGQGLSPSREPYSLVQIAVPLGVGLKYAVDRRWLISVEYGLRKTFTDYIDDASTTYYPQEKLIAQAKQGSVSALAADPTEGTWSGADSYEQRANPTNNDSFMFLIIAANYKLKTNRAGFPKWR